VAVKKHIFGSNIERTVWNKLHHRWGDRYSLHPNLPFLFVFDTHDLLDPTGLPERPPTPFKLSDIEVQRLKKTSIDYTFCDAEDAPLVCIEFDGMLDGYNLGTDYVTAELSDPWRETITSLKLKVAHGSGFPYFVVGSPQVKDISEAVKLCIVDALVGDVLAGRDFEKRASAFTPEEIGMTSEEFDRLSPINQDELVQDWLIGAEVDADTTNNPVFAAEFELYQKLSERLGIVKWNVGYLYKPSIESARTVLERAKLMESAKLIGAECTVTTQQFGEVKRTVWLPNFNVPGFSPYGFLEELARLVAFDALRQLADARG
jgi:hypothetical protein